jgi:hypothetical protein
MKREVAVRGFFGLVIILTVFALSMASFYKLGDSLGPNSPTANVVLYPLKDNLCGNGVVDFGENCKTCSKDVTSREICDNKDNDCDSFIDDNNVCSTPARCGSFGNACLNNEQCHQGVCGNPVVSLHFDEGRGNLTMDSSGNIGTGELKHLVKWKKGSICQLGNCVYLSEGLDYIVFQEKEVGKILNDQFTVSFWAKSGMTRQTPSFGFADSQRYRGNNPLVSYDESLIVSGTGKSLGGTQLFKTYLPNAPLNKWMHYAIVDNGKNYLVYVNGKLDHSEAVDKHPASESKRRLIIGESGFEGRYKDNFNGYMDEFMIYDRALSPKEISSIVFSGVN